MKSRFVGGLAVCALLLAGCDPGIYLRPIGWTEISPMVHATQIGVVELRVHDVGGLIGQDYSSLALTIVNPQHEVFVIEGAKLRTNGEEYVAKVWKEYRCCADGADPADLTRQESTWWFDRPIYKVFGKTGELDLEIREAQSRRIVTVKLEQ
jgi:hypothetical protein